MANIELRLEEFNTRLLFEVPVNKTKPYNVKRHKLGQFKLLKSTSSFLLKKDHLKYLTNQ